MDFEETEQSKIFDNADFGYWKVTVERPLRIEGIDPNRAYKAAEIKKLKEKSGPKLDAPLVIRRIHKRGTSPDPLRGRFERMIAGHPRVVEYEPDTGLRDTETDPAHRRGRNRRFHSPRSSALCSRCLVSGRHGEDRVRDQLHSPLLQA